MAIPTNYIDKITDNDSGESRPICPPAEHVSVDNENFEGETLDEVLNEVSQAIEEAGQGGYAPPQGGIPKTDLAQSVQDSLDKADTALQEEDLADYATKTELQQGLGGKQDTINDLASIRTGAGKGATAVQSVSVESEEDGTVDIHVDDDTYTINLNHEHPQYQPLLTAGSNITITTDPQTGEVTISAAGGSGGSGISGITMNGTAVTVNNGVANLGTVLTQHQSLAGRVQSQDVVNIVKITQSGYDALSVKDSTTLYLITES